MRSARLPDDGIFQMIGASRWPCRHCRELVLRFLLLFPTLLLLAGCSGDDWANATSFGATSASASAAPGAPSAAAAANYESFRAQPTDASRCAEVARQRAGDAAAQGFEDDVRQQVYDRTYASCMDWAAQKAAR